MYKNFTDKEVQHLLTLYAGAALPAIITNYRPDPTLIAKVSVDHAEALLLELDHRLSYGNSSK